MSAKAKGERKVRRQEPNQYQVRWQENDSIYFRYFKRDRYAVQFMNELVSDGIEKVLIKMVEVK
jgi:hypothetical protein